MFDLEFDDELFISSKLGNEIDNSLSDRDDCNVYSEYSEVRGDECGGVP